MLGWVRAFENNSTNVGFAQVRCRSQSQNILVSDHYKLTASHDTSTFWSAKGYKVANDRRYILCSAIISTLPETGGGYPYTCYDTPEQGSHGRV